MEKICMTYDEYKKNKLEESNFILVSKRRRGESDAQYTSTKAPLRKKVLEFISNKKLVSEEELQEFLNTVSEEVGFKPSPNWLANNKQYVKAKYDKGELVGYRLSESGERVLSTLKKYESLRDDIKKELLDDMSGKRARINDKVNFDSILTGKSNKKMNENESYEELDEAKIASGYLYSNVSMRNQILEFIESKGSVSLDELKVYFASLKESLGKSPSLSYLSSNKHLIERNINKKGISTYKLTPLGRKVIGNSKISENNEE